MDRGDKLAQFVSLTDADPEFATSFLEASGWNVETAVANFLDAAGHASGGSGGGGRGPGGHGSHGGGSRGSGRSHDSGWGEDDVRAAMDTRVEQLVGGAVSAGPRAGGAAVAYVPQVHSAFRNFEAERAGAGSRPGKGGGGTRSLASIMGPPLALIFPGNWEQVRAEAKSSGRWVLVNVQSDSEFDSWRLNRDTWKDETLQEVVRAGFVFWQQSMEMEVGGGGGGGRAGVTVSRSVDNPAAVAFARRFGLDAPAEWPKICIIDPRACELVFTHTGFISAGRLTELLTDWMTRHSMEDCKPITRTDTRDPKRPPPPGSSSAASSSGAAAGAGGGGGRPRAAAAAAAASSAAAVVDLTEEEQLQLAMQASLTELTEGAGAGKAPAAPAVAPSSASSFSSRSAAAAAAAASSSSSSAATAPAPTAAPAAAARPASTRSSVRSAGGGFGAASEGAGGGEGYESDYSLEWVEDEDGDGASAPAPASTRAAQSGKGAVVSSSSCRQGSMDSEASSGSLKRPRHLDAAAAATAGSDAAAAAAGEQLAGTRSPAKMARRDSKHDSAHAGAGAGAAGSGGGGISLAPPPQVSSLPAEFAPPAGAPASSVSRIMLRMPDGSRQQRKFGSGEPVAALFHWAGALLQRPHPLAAAYGSVLASPVVAGDPAAVTPEAVTLALQRVRMPSPADGAVASSAPWDIVRSHAVGGASRSLSGPLPGMFAGCQSFAAGGLLAAQLHVSLDTKEWGTA